MVLFGSAAHSATIHVPGDAPTIQGGVDLAAFGDTVEVACGTYTEDVTLKDGIVVRSTTGMPECVTVSAPNNGHAFRCSNLPSSVVIEGFRMVPSATIGRGMGIASSSVQIRNCRIENFDAPGEECTIGGGMFISASTVQLEYTTLEGNDAWGEAHCGWGGGIACYYNSTLIIRHCVFNNNRAPRGSGGAIFSNDGTSIIEVSDTEFLANHAADGGSAIAIGSAIPYGSDGDPDQLTISNCIFRNNSGGGFAGVIAGKDFTLEGNLFEGNAGGHSGITAFGFGSRVVENCTFRDNSYSLGILMMYGSPGVLRGCIFAENNLYDSPYALVTLAGSVEIDQCTFVGNRCNGVVKIGEQYLGQGTLQVRNSIIAFSETGQAIVCDQQSTATPECCDLYGNPGGDWVGCVAGQNGVNGNMSLDPLFCDFAGGDYTLQANSPCAPPQSGACGQIGAFGVGCEPVHVETKSWGAIKGLYR